jgi:hypothetical protein
VDEGFQGFWEPLVFPAEASTFHQPREVSLDDPSAGKHYEQLQLVALDDLDDDVTSGSCPRYQLPEFARPAEYFSSGLFLARSIQRHRFTNEVLQRTFVNRVIFFDVDGMPDLPVKAGVE